MLCCIEVIELTEVSALWLLKIILPKGSDVPEMSLGAKSLWVSADQISTVKTTLNLQ